MSENNNTQQVIYYNSIDEFDEDLNFNFEKIFYTIWSRRELIIKVFAGVLLFFILLTFIMPKKYKVTADLYINKSNNSNMMEVNPYFLDETGGSPISMGADKQMNNEMQLMASALVLDKVIRDNNIKYKKGKKKGEYLTAKAFYKKGKKLKIENVKNSNVISITYTAAKPELAYGVVSSLITNYIELHKELNTKKSRADKKLLEQEYNKSKENLNKKLNQASGMPVQALTGMGNLSALSAFSNSAQQAMGTLKGQYLAGVKSQIAVEEESQKVNSLAQKLEWARMVEEMSDSSKVLVISEPILPRSFEKSSPKLLINIILGCIFGGLASLIALIVAESMDKKLSYSKLSDNIIYDVQNHIDTLKAEVINNNKSKILLVSFLQIPAEISDRLQGLPNLETTYADVSYEFNDKLDAADKVILLSQIMVTNKESYDTIRKVIKTKNKEILADALI